MLLALARHARPALGADPGMDAKGAMLFKRAFPRGDCRLENSLEVEKMDVMDVQSSRER